MAALVILAVMGGWFFWNGKKPNYNDTVRSEQLKAAVEVLYDDYGIPHIYAQNEKDLFFALGYAHAQDRLFQMEILRRLAAGRLSEVLGDATIKVDKLFRTLSFKQYAQYSIAKSYSDPTDSATIAAKAYLAGINHFVTTGKTPIEFDLIGIPKTPFTLEDVELVNAYMAFSFSEGLKAEPVTNLIQQKYGSKYLKDLVLGWSDNMPKIGVSSGANHLLSLSTSMMDIEQEAAFPPFHGSNSWILGPSKTKSHKPLFCNDTHIGFSQPSVFYEAHLECPGFSFYGNFLAGTPVAVLGHNQYGGWGLTMSEHDDVDMYREKSNPANRDEVWATDKWQKMDVREEVIKVKGKAD